MSDRENILSKGKNGTAIEYGRVVTVDYDKGSKVIHDCSECYDYCELIDFEAWVCFNRN